uniref:Chitin-binding type-2 domain-containing protein n=1 Tax=Anopheles epiroticus TaxID=199890 RepID=A0A182P7G9_9DIPT
MASIVGSGWQLPLVLLLVATCCLGAPADIFADNSLCPAPRCVTYQEINTLWAVPDPAYFLQCRPSPLGDWTLQQMPCAPATLFSFRQQVCVRPEYWEGCAGTPTVTSPTTPIPSSTDANLSTDGSLSTTVTIPPGIGDSFCQQAKCVTYEEINTLWNDEQPNYFCQCRPIGGAWAPIRMPCAPSTIFSFRHQVCVWQEEN